MTDTHTHTHTQQNCKICGHYPNENGKRTCDRCIEEYRPKLSVGWLIFWALLGILPAIIYYFVKKNNQEEWDRQNL